MSLSHFMFKPKYGPEIVNKVLKCFVDQHLNWFDYGVDWDVRPLKDRDGWYQLSANPSYDGSALEGWSETCFSDQALTGKELTEDMMILLVEAGVAWNVNMDNPEDSAEYTLEDVELTQVIAALSEDDSHVFSPWDDRCFVLNVKTGMAKHHDMTDLIFSLAAA